MKVFISWSGKLSREVALLLHDWLPGIIQSIKPYVSAEDIEKGARWEAEISRELDESTFGIVCLTRENAGRPWILFEAGAISKSVERGRLVPLLIDIGFSDVQQPLAQFQAATTSKEDMWRIVRSIYGVLGEDRPTEELVQRAFDKWWPDFERGVQEARQSVEEEASQLPVRTERELLEEMLGLLRSMTRTESDKVSSPTGTSLLPIELTFPVTGSREERLLWTRRLIEQCARTMLDDRNRIQERLANYTAVQGAEGTEAESE